MRLRYQMALAIFVTGCLGVAALLADRVGFMRQILYGRAETRALAIAESVGRLMVPHMQNAELRPLSKGVSAFAGLPNVAYIRIVDERGGAVFESDARRFKSPLPPDGRDEMIEVQVRIKDATTGKDYGSVQLGVVTTGLRDSLKILAWRGAAVGILAILALALVALAIGTFLGRKLELLTDAVERIKNDGTRAASLGHEVSEVDRLASAFSALHQRLIDEESQLKKLESFKSELTSMLVHDMKHPVAILGAALSALESGDHESGELLAMAKTAVGRENAMIEDLLQLAKLNSSEMPLQRTRMTLGGFLQDCARENALLAAQSGRPWRSSFDALSPCWIYGDAASLRRVIGNLVMNAVDHTPPGTPITLGARLAGREKIEIFVCDEGPGIPADKREAIFRSFNGAGGPNNLGIGLAYCRIVAEKHSGRLEVKSDAGEGSFFALVLPVSNRAMISENA